MSKHSARAKWNTANAGLANEPFTADKIFGTKPEIEYEIRLPGKEWEPATEQAVREILDIFYRDVDEVIAEIVAGEEAYAGCDIRVKPQPQPVQE